MRTLRVFGRRRAAVGVVKVPRWVQAVIHRVAHRDQAVVPLKPDCTKKKGSGDPEPFIPVRKITLWHDHLVDHVDHAVRGDDICGGDVGVVNAHTMGAVDMYRGALNGLDRKALSGKLVGGYRAGNDMIRQDRDELILVLWLQQGFDSPRRQRREGFVGWREDRERAVTLERVNEARSLDSSDKG